MTTNNEQTTAMQAQSGNSGVMTVDDMKKQVQLIQHVMKEVMKKGEHFGTIPGCGDKPTLLKPGAEKISMVFRLAPEYTVERVDTMEDGHREYQVTCTLRHIDSGKVLGGGVGCCSTMEGKYRFRTEFTGQPVPAAYWKTRDRDLLGGTQFSTRKVKGKWEIIERVEHDNPADYYNTVLKMAKKRAHTDAVLTATAASDIFTQDIEDMPEVINTEQEEGNGKDPVTPPSRKSATISEKEQARLGKLAKDKGWGKDQLQDMIKQAFHISSFAAITPEIAKPLEEMIKNGPPESIDPEEEGGAEDAGHTMSFCPKCDGTGQEGGNGDVDCPACNGSGVV